MKKLIVLFASVALVLSFAATASADWNFYGSARMATFWNNPDPGDGNLGWAQQGNSRTGGSAKKDAVGGGFEFGFDTGDRDNIDLRKLYGTWNFGAGTLLVGQTYNPVNLFAGNQVYNGDGGLLNYGLGFYGGRNGMIQFSFGSFKIALVENIGGGIETSPKFEASYAFKSDLFSLQFVGGYQTSEVGGADVSSYVLAGQLNIGLGPAKVKASAGFGQNTAAYGLWLNGDAGLAGDIDSLTAGASVGFKATDMLSLEGGVGYTKSEGDGGGENEAIGYYIQCAVSMAPGVYIIPELGFLDDSEAGGGEMTYFGAKWQINF